MFKFIFGPVAGYGAGLHLGTTILATVMGMMTSVVAFTFFGDWLRKKVLIRLLRNRKKFNPGNRRAVRIRTTLGLAGIALLTPLLLTPIGGTLLAVSVSPNREKIIFYMLISACFWSVILTFAVYFGVDTVMNFVNTVQPVYPSTGNLH